MLNLTQELLSFDQILADKKTAVLQKTTKMIIDSDKIHEKNFASKKEQFKEIETKELKKLNEYCNTFEDREKKSYLDLKKRLKEQKNLSLHVKDIVAFIKQDLCTTKRF